MFTPVNEIFLILEFNDISEECESLEKLNDIVGAKSENIPGWNNIDLINGIWNFQSHKGQYRKNVWDNCFQDNSWFAYRNNDEVGTLCTTLPTSGSAELSFGNCWDKGIVKVYLDGSEIGLASPKQNKTIPFNFTSGAILLLQSENSVIQFTKFNILKCGLIII